MNQWQKLLSSGQITRKNVLKKMFIDSLQESMVENNIQMDKDTPSCRIMGTNKQLTIEKWNSRKDEIKESLGDAKIFKKSKSIFNIVKRQNVIVTAIASIFKGGKYIEQFLENITNQTIFDEYSELIIIDANSPDNEIDIIKKFLKDNPSSKIKLVIR